MKKTSKIFVAGHLGLVGSSLIRKLKKDGYKNIITRTRKELDLLNQKKVDDFFKTEKPEYVFMSAAKVGGIMANKTYPAEFIYENLLVETNIIHSAHIYKVKKLLFLGSSCIYPRLAPQPINERFLLTSELEPTNEPYAIAKIAGLIMCQSYNKQYGDNFISVMPTNLYGPNDNFDYENSHVLPAMLRKFHEAKKNNLPNITLWGTGNSKREFLHVDDLASACIFLMCNYNKPDIVNIGTGEDISIKKLAEKIKKTVNYEGKIYWDTSKPDGTPRKLLDVSRLHLLGWKHTIQLDKGLNMTYTWYKKNKKSLRI